MIERKLPKEQTVQHTFEYKNGDTVEKWDVMVSLRKLSVEERAKLGLKDPVHAKHFLYCEGKILKTGISGESECHFTLRDYGGKHWSVQQMAVGIPSSWDASTQAFMPSERIYEHLRDLVLKT